jgi:ubiquinone/menaquinone biosynthesis C-methylase UbiE
VDISITRAPERYWTTIDSAISLAGKLALDVGCGDGSRSMEIARRCRFLNGIDPDEKAIALANRRMIKNAAFAVGDLETVRLRNDWYDVVFFTMSFHHVAPERMTHNINLAIRTCKPGGYVVFVEPDLHGSLYEAEALFDVFDGDERIAKQQAQAVITAHPNLHHLHQLEDETAFRFRSFQSFVQLTAPKRNLAKVVPFLEDHKENDWYVLRAPRRIWICSGIESLV